MSDSRAYVPGCTHDVFVSYAHVDDEPPQVAEVGWVTTLVEEVKRSLAQRLGRPDNFSLWMDHELSRHRPLSAEIMAALEQTAVLLIVLSEGYVSSEWCQREAHSFLRHVAERGGRSGSVFVVERIPLDERPPELDELKGYRFWVRDAAGHAPRTLGEPVPDPAEHRYWNLLNDLGHDLASELKNLRRGKESGQPEEAVQDERFTVFLAETTDDLEDPRDGTRRHLDQMGLRVLPEVYYPRDPARFRQAAAEDLARSELFVQLLGPFPGKSTPDLPQGYVRLQHELAVSSEIPVLQWRSPELDLAAVCDEAHRRLLDGPTVMASSLQELRQEIVAQSRQRKEEAATTAEPLSAFVFVDSEEEDWDLARDVCRVLDDLDVGYALPLQTGTPSEIRNDLKQNLVECDALIVIYGRTAPAWVREQLVQLRRELRNRERPLGALAVFEGPPAEKSPVDFKLPHMQQLDCHDGVDAERLRQFLDSLRQNGGP